MGPSPQMASNPERVASVPDIRLVEGQFVPLQQPAELVLKRQLAVMLCLPLDVTTDFFDLGMTDGEDAVTALPSEGGELRRTRLDPERRAAFVLLDHVGGRAGVAVDLSWRRQRAEGSWRGIGTWDEDGEAGGVIQPFQG